MNQDIEAIKSEALAELEAAAGPEDVKEISVRYLGRKGRITQFLRGISALPAAERPGAGKRANEVKGELEAACEATLERLADVELDRKVLAELAVSDPSAFSRLAGLASAQL